MSKMSRDEFLRSVENVVPRTHEVEQSILDGKISDDNREYTLDKVTGLDPDGRMISIRNVSHKTCDFGHLLQPKTNLSECQQCGKVTCPAVEGSYKCSYSCIRCGAAICRKCASMRGSKEAYCPKCRWYKYVAILFEIIIKVVK
jgi:hypothetical protein